MVVRRPSTTSVTLAMGVPSGSLAGPLTVIVDPSTSIESIRPTGSCELGATVVEVVVVVVVVVVGFTVVVVVVGLTVVVVVVGLTVVDVVEVVVDVVVVVDPPRSIVT